MRLTWLVLGVVVAAAAVAFINTDEAPAPLPKATDGQGTPPLNRTTGEEAAQPGFDLSISEAEIKAEKRAKTLLRKLAEARAEGGKGAAPIQAAIRKEVWDTPSARRHAYVEGRRLLASAGSGMNRDTIAKKDRARRLLSRVLYLPEMFTSEGAPTTERTRLIDTIQKLNRQVMLYGPGIEGVTVPYKVPMGIVPVQIVSRQKLPMGSNALLYWNQGGNLDPKRVRGNQTLLLPQEELTLHVHLKWRRLGIYIGDWFVKEWQVGIGAEGSPTPTGEFRILSRQLNPDWHPRGSKVIYWGDPKNELGDAWMAIESREWPESASYGIHGTNKPETVGTRCSKGCVRLVNAGAVELRDWVRTASAGGKATRVFIR